MEATVTFPGDAPDQVSRCKTRRVNDVLAQVLDRTCGHTAHVLFSAKVPSVGFATYTVQKGPGPDAACFPTRSHVSNQGSGEQPATG